MNVEPEVIPPLLQVEAPKQKIFRRQAIWGGSLLGGPLAAGYIIAHNYKVFGELQKAKMAWIVAGLATLLVLWISFILEGEDSMTRLLPFVYSGVASMSMEYLQGKKIEEYMGQGGPRFTGWRVAGVGLISLLAFLAVIFGYLFLTDPTVTMSVKTYGETKNEIYYGDGLTVDEVDKVAYALQDVGLFTDEQTVSLLLENNNGTYEVSISLIDDYWLSDAPTIAAYQQVRDAVQERFTTHKVVFNLCAPDDIRSVKKTLR